MPPCSIKQCTAKKHINPSELTIHNLPKNEALRRKWLDIIGEKNINPRHKDPRICSFHFEKSCFNRTLRIVRLRDNAMPSAHLVPSHKNINERYLCEFSHVQDQASSAIIQPHISNKDMDPVNEKVRKSTKLFKMQQVYDRQKKEIKRLNEKARRQEKIITRMKDLIMDLKHNVIINKKQ